MTVRDIEIQVTPPEKTNVAWVNPQDSILRLFVNGQWRPIGDNGDLSKLEEKGIDTSGTLADTLVEIVNAIPEGGGSDEPLIIDNATIDASPGSSFASVTAEENATITKALNAGRSVFINATGTGYLQVFPNLGGPPFFLVSDTQGEAPRCCYIQVDE